jgi:hypothetical protein
MVALAQHFMWFWREIREKDWRLAGGMPFMDIK